MAEGAPVEDPIGALEERRRSLLRIRGETLLRRQSAQAVVRKADEELWRLDYLINLVIDELRDRRADGGLSGDFP